MAQRKGAHENQIAAPVWTRGRRWADFLVAAGRSRLGFSRVIDTEQLEHHTDMLIDQIRLRYASVCPTP
jgi:hypothetical protein